jgi:hypothetical protein
VSVSKELVIEAKTQEADCSNVSLQDVATSRQEKKDVEGTSHDEEKGTVEIAPTPTT